MPADVNHIIHGCSHPKWRDNAYGSELEIFQGIQQYLERLVRTCRQEITWCCYVHVLCGLTQCFVGCRPERLVMIAIDGVAPQAKMCQQRTRRFMSAHTEQLRKGIEKEVLCRHCFCDPYMLHFARMHCTQAMIMSHKDPC